MSIVYKVDLEIHPEYYDAYSTGGHPAGWSHRWFCVCGIREAFKTGGARSIQAVLYDRYVKDTYRCSTEHGLPYAEVGDRLVLLPPWMERYLKRGPKWLGVWVYE